MNTEKLFTTRNIVIISLMFLAALCRLVPAPEYRMWNFSPVGAIALFGGAFIADRKQAILLTLSVLFLSDVLLEIFNGTGFHSLMPWVYGSFVLITFIGRFVAKLQKGYSSVVIMMVAPCLTSMLFFIVTNFGVWAQGSYGYTGIGLLECYVAAIPFHKGTILGDFFFTLVLFSSFSIAKLKYPSLLVA